jgi:hypothetical protein
MKKTRMFFLDTEFVERPSTIELISVGIVCENGKEFYGINGEADLSGASDWVQKNVLQPMPEYNPIGNQFRRTNGVYKRYSLANEIHDFVCMQTAGLEWSPEFWGYYADYDWVVFCWLFGPMIRLPKGYPMYCRDIKQLCDLYGNPKLPKEPDAEHNALADARWNMQAFNFLVREYVGLMFNTIRLAGQDNG